MSDKKTPQSRKRHLTDPDVLSRVAEGVNREQQKIVDAAAQSEIERLLKEWEHQIGNGHSFPLSKTEQRMILAHIRSQGTRIAEMEKEIGIAIRYIEEASQQLILEDEYCMLQNALACLYPFRPPHEQN